MNLKDYKEVLNNLKRYNTFQEKEGMLYSLDDEKTAMKMAKILGSNPNNEFEAIAFIFKLREISVSDLIDLNHVCPECDYMNLQVVSIPNMFFKDLDNIDESVPIGLFNDIEDIPDSEFTENINTISIDQFNEIEEKILSNNLKIFNPAIDLVCKKCGSKDKISIDYANIVSKFSVTNIYEQYLDISHFSNMTKYDTDNMFPFEREIFLSLIQVKEDEKK